MFRIIFLVMYVGHSGRRCVKLLRNPHSFWPLPSPSWIKNNKTSLRIVSYFFWVVKLLLFKCCESHHYMVSIIMMSLHYNMCPLSPILSNESIVTLYMYTKDNALLWNISSVKYCKIKNIQQNTRLRVECSINSNEHRNIPQTTVLFLIVWRKLVMILCIDTYNSRPFHSLQNKF